MKVARLNEILDYKDKSTNNGILTNKLNLEDQDLLEKAERMITSYKLSRLYLNPGKQSFDINHYLSIHKYLFEDIYEFAGCIRSEVINKVIPFCLPHLIYSNLKSVLENARKKSKYIETREELVSFIATLYSDLDIIHPFREGNGRCEREFIRQYVIEISKQNNLDDYIINYENITDKNEFIKAVIIADSTCNTSYLETFIDKMIVTNNTYSKKR